MTFKERVLKFSMVGAAVLTSFGTAAQETQSNLVLEEIIVTAQKRAENIQDVPISISTIPEERLDAFLDGGADIRALAGRIPSLNVEGSSGRSAPRFYIRGLGNVDFDLSASQPVSIVMDDVVVENVLFKSFPLFDIERAEVLKGPQGTLFGRNTPAGIVKFDTVKPSGDTEGYISGSFGSFDSIRATGAVGGALSDNVNARLAFQYNSRDDYVRNTNPNAAFAGNGDSEDDLEDFEDIAVRLHLGYEPNDKFSSLLTLQYRDLEGTTSLFRANILSPGSNELNSNFDRRSVTFDGGNNNVSLVETTSGTLKLEYDFGEVTLASLTGYYSGENFGRGDIDGGTGAAFLGFSTPGFIPFPSDTGSTGNNLEQFTQEVRFSNSNPDKLKWQAGLFYFDDEFELDSFGFNGLGGDTRTLTAITNQQTDAWAIFGQLSYDVSDKLNITGGLRYSDDSKELVGERTLGATTAFDSRAVSDTHVSWDLSATYFLNDNVNLYARLANGFRAPSLQGRLLFGNQITVADSETVDSLDIGIKSELLNRRLRLNASAFFYQINDPQFTAIGGIANSNALINADEGEGKGFELDIDYLATENLKLTLGFSYNDTEIIDSNLRVASCGGGCTVLDPTITAPNGRTQLASINGNPFPQAPETILSATAKYSLPVRNGEFYVFADYNRSGETNFFLYESAEFNYDGNFELGMRVGYINEVANYEVAIFGRNITDEENLVGGIDFNNLTGFVNDPRIIGVEFKYDF